MRMASDVRPGHSRTNCAVGRDEMCQNHLLLLLLLKSVQDLPLPFAHHAETLLQCCRPGGCLKLQLQQLLLLCGHGNSRGSRQLLPLRLQYQRRRCCIRRWHPCGQSLSAAARDGRAPPVLNAASSSVPAALQCHLNAFPKSVIAPSALHGYSGILLLRVSSPHACSTEQCLDVKE